MAIPHSLGKAVAGAVKPVKNEILPFDPVQTAARTGAAAVKSLPLQQPDPMQGLAPDVTPDTKDSDGPLGFSNPLAPLDTHVRYFLDAVAKAGEKPESDVDALLAGALEGKSPKEYASEKFAEHANNKALEFTLKNLHLSDAELKEKWEAEMMGSGTLEEFGKVPIPSPSGSVRQAASVARQKAEVVEEMAKVFGRDVGEGIIDGTLPPERVQQEVVPRMTTQQFDQAFAVFENLLGSVPQPPQDDTAAMRVHQNQLWIAAIASVFAPKYAFEALAMPYQWLNAERARRKAELQEQYGNEMTMWREGVRSAQSALGEAARMDIARYQGEVDVYQAEQQNRRTEITQGALNNRAVLNANTKLTIQEAKTIENLADTYWDPKTDLNAKAQIREEIRRRTGQDVANGIEPVKSYVQANTEARTAQTVETTNLTRLRQEEQRVKNHYAPILAESGLRLDDARAKQIAVITSLLPQQFDLKRMEALARIDDMMFDNRLNARKYEQTERQAAAGIANEAAVKLEAKAQNLRNTIVDLTDSLLSMDPGSDEYKNVSELIEIYRGNAQLADAEAEILREDAKEVLGGQDFAPPVAGAPAAPGRAVIPGDLGASYAGKYTYSMKRGPGQQDCSSFTQCVFKDQGIDIPATAQAQYNASRPLENNEVMPGDLIFFRDTKPSDGRKGLQIHHVGLVAEVDADGRVLMRHMSSAANDVQDIYLDEYVKEGGRMKFQGFRRPDAADSEFRQPAKADKKGGSQPSKLADHSAQFAASFGIRGNSYNQLVKVMDMVEAGQGWAPVSDLNGLKRGDYVWIFDDPNKNDARVMVVEDYGMVTGLKLRAGDKVFTWKGDDDRRMMAFRRTN